MSEPNTPPPPPASAPEPTSSGGGGASSSGGASNNTVMLILSYLGPLALVPFLVEKDDQQVQWHAKHGIVLMLAWIIVSIVMSIVSSILASIFAPLGCIVGLLSIAVLVVGVGVHVVCIMKALNGERFIIPGLSQYADKF